MLLSAVKLPVIIGTLTLFKYNNNCEKFRLVTLVDAKWMELGYRVDLNQNQLNGMEKQYLKDPRRCWCEVMSKWMDSEEVTWEKIYDVLRDIGCDNVARSLKRALFLADHKPPTPQPPRKRAAASRDIVGELEPLPSSSASPITCAAIYSSKHSLILQP